MRTFHCGGFSCRRAQALGLRASVAEARGFLGLVVSWHVESSWTRDQTPVPCRGRQILIHSFTREVPCGLFWTEGNQDPTDSRKLFTSLHCLKEFKSGAARKRAISRDNFLAARLTYLAGHISALLIFLWSALLPFEASGPYIPLSECHTTLNYLTAFGFHIGAEGSVHIFYGNPIHTKFVFLLLLFLTLI